MQAVGEDILCPMRKMIFRFASNDASMKQVGKISVKGDLAETNHDANAWQGLNLTSEVGGAVTDLLGQRLISGWSTANDRGNPGVTELKAIIAINGARLGRQAKFVQDGIHEVAGTIPGKRAASTIGSVSAGGQAENKNAGAGVAEAGNRARPVSLILVGAALRFADTAAVVTKPGTAFTGDDGVANLLEEWGRILCIKRWHCIS